MKILRILFVSLLFITTACTSFQPGAAASIEVPSSWRLISYGKPGAETQVVEGSNVTVEFSEGGKLGGSGGCNSYGGSYVVSGSTIKISNLASTLMACADESITGQETQFLTNLQSATGFQLSGDKLTIFYGDGQQLNFAKK